MSYNIKTANQYYSRCIETNHIICGLMSQCDVLQYKNSKSILLNITQGALKLITLYVD